VSSRVVVLVPPSRTTAPGGGVERRRDEFADALGEPRAAARAALVALGELAEADRARLLGARGVLLARADAANRAAGREEGPWLAAGLRYRGVLWRHLDPATLPAATRRRLLVLSGLYGLTSAADEIAEYRLAMGVSLPGLGALGAHWRDAVSDTLAERCDRAVVLDLLTREYDAVLDPARLGEHSRVVRARFTSPDGTRLVGHDAKAVKGRLARAVLEGGLAAIDAFTWAGWRAERRGDEVVVVAPAAR
jgi:cytoplasmic iron level regulating protein YaaA (DUF328/UPF0246 family)